nr:MAG TPA: hypothetical protein [Caudoviricetes sp.]
MTRMGRQCEPTELPESLRRGSHALGVDSTSHRPSTVDTPRRLRRRA